jgi:hypothetical protein
MLLASIAVETALGSAKDQKYRQSARVARSTAPLVRPSGRAMNSTPATMDSASGSSHPATPAATEPPRATPMPISMGRAAGTATSCTPT